MVCATSFRPALALLLVAGMATGCASGRILVTGGDFRRFDLPSTGKTVGVRGVPRAETNMYQGSLENLIVRGLRESGAFRAVRQGDFSSSDVDLELRLGPATAWFNSRVHPLYFPLAIATLTLYIWFGGPIRSHYQQYGMRVSAFDRDGTLLFELEEKDWYHHGVGIYSSENNSLRCRGNDADRLVKKLVRSVSTAVATAGSQ